MPMAKKRQNTVARLAMGTALLSVVSGCDNTIGKSYDNVSNSITGGPVLVTPTPTSPLISLPAATPVASPAYVAPGAPTYSETSQAANLQTFEDVYGPPVTSATLETSVSSEDYTIPSYNDGSVVAQPLSALPLISAASVERPTYTQRVTEAIAAPDYDLAPADSDTLVYGESLTSTSYAVAPASNPVLGEVVVQETIMEDTVSVVPDVVESESIQETVVLEPVPTLGTESTTLSYADTIPMTDIMAVSVAEPLTSQYSAVETETVEAKFAVVEPSIQSAPKPYTGAVEIIGNEEAIATYGPAPAPAIDVFGEQLQTEPLTEPDTFFQDDTTSLSVPTIEVATLRAPEPVVSPAPIRKVAAVAEVVDYGPVFAPIPRARPSSSERRFATLTAPLPQPRPAYKEPMAVATTSGNYVSVGALDDVTLTTVPAVVDTAMIISDELDVVAVPMPEPASIVIEEASVQIPAPEAPEVANFVNVQPQARIKTSSSELSGTSWRLIEVDSTAVSVNAELHFDGASGFAGGQGPCNSYGGEYSNANESRFSMTNIFSTRASCPNIDLETAYLEALKEAGAYEINADFSNLTLLDRNGQTIARFKAF